MNLGGLAFGLVVWIILVGWAFFYYDKSTESTMGFVLLSGVYWIVSYIGLIPVVGPIIYWILIAFWLEPSLLATTGLTHGDPITVAFWLNIIGSIIYSVVTSIALLYFIFKD